MPDRLFRIYQQHKIVNVNLNVIGAGFLAVAIANWPVAVATAQIGAEHKLINAVVAAVLDGIADVVIYFALHWFANHWRPGSLRRKPAAEPAAEPAAGPKARFWREATLVQFERLTLTPAFLIIAIGGMWGLQHAGMAAGWAYVLSFSSAIVVTRVAHTIWGLKTGRFEIPRRSRATVESPAASDASRGSSDAA